MAGRAPADPISSTRGRESPPSENPVRNALTLIASLVIAASALAAPPAAQTQRFEQCRAKLKKAQTLEVLYDLTWEKGREPRVVVGRIFMNLPIDAREGFAETVDCFLMTGDPKMHVNFNLLHWQTGRPVARFENGKYKP